MALTIRRVSRYCSGHQLEDLRQRLDEDANELAAESRQRRELEAELANVKASMTKEVRLRREIKPLWWHYANPPYTIGLTSCTAATDSRP